MPKFSDLLILFSGANPKYLEQCPNEKQKFLPIGLSIFVTTCLAIISMYYASSLIFGGASSDNHVFVICFSLFWGIAIFSIDWGLVKTMKKRKKERFFLIRLFTIPVLFRLAVAVLISFSISRPLEIAIYEQRLKAQIETDRQAFIRNEMEMREAEMKRMTDPLDTISKKRQENAEKLAAGPQTLQYQQNLEAYNKCNEELKSLKSRNEPRINRLYADNRYIRKAKEYRDTTNNNLTKNALNLISRNNRTAFSLRNEISKKESYCKSIYDKLDEEIIAHRNVYLNLEEIDAVRSEGYIEDIQDKRLRDSIALAEIEGKAKISFNPENPGLITSLEALANFEKTPEGQKVWIVRLILLLIFICIDTAPIIVKLLTKYGPYEALQAADEEKMKYLATAEKNANMLLISNIATVQNRVLRLAIDQYAKEELNRLKEEANYHKNFVHNESSNDRRMINQCPACESQISNGENKGHCTVCGWEFITFLTPFEEGQNQLKERLEIARNYIQSLQDGSEEMKQKMAKLETGLKDKAEELTKLIEKSKSLEVELEEALRDQNFIAANQHYKGKRVRIEYRVDDSGDIIININEPIFKLPTIMMVIKNGSIPVADPKFGSDGTFVAVINPKLWRVATQTSFTMKKEQINRIFPCLSGKYTFSMISAIPHFNLVRKGNDNDVSNVQLNFN